MVWLCNAALKWDAKEHVSRQMSSPDYSLCWGACLSEDSTRARSQWIFWRRAYLCLGSTSCWEVQGCAASARQLISAAADGQHASCFFAVDVAGAGRPNYFIAIIKIIFNGFGRTLAMNYSFSAITLSWRLSCCWPLRCCSVAELRLLSYCCRVGWLSTRIAWWMVGLSCATGVGMSNPGRSFASLSYFCGTVRPSESLGLRSYQPLHRLLLFKSWVAAMDAGCTLIFTTHAKITSRK